MQGGDGFGYTPSLVSCACACVTSCVTTPHLFLSLSRQYQQPKRVYNPSPYIAMYRTAHRKIVKCRIRIILHWGVSMEHYIGLYRLLSRQNCNEGKKIFILVGIREGKGDRLPKENEGEKGKQYLSVLLDTTMIDRIDLFRSKYRFASRTEAIRWLLDFALRQEPKPEWWPK